jgi:hypothetical protein
MSSSGLLATLLLVPNSAASPEPALPPPPGPVICYRHYATLFGAQSVPFRIRYTHTWGTVVRTAVTPTGEYPVQIDTVSWMPATLEIRPLALRPEPGVT